MATRAITLTLSVRDADTVRRELEKIGPAGEEAIRRLDTAAKKGTEGVKGTSAAAGELQNVLGNLGSRAGAVGSALSGMGAAGLAAGAAMGGLAVGLTRVATAGDEMVAALGRIRAATGSIESARDVYEQLYRLSLQTGQSVAESAGQFARFSIATKEIGATNAQAVKLVEIMQKAASIGGASTQEASAAALQLGQALASGVLQGEELRSLLENMPNLAVALARELGVGIGQLRKMGSEGELTADKVLPAILRGAEEINREYDRMPVTMSRAFDQLTVAAGGFAAVLDEALGISRSIAAALQSAAGILNGLRDRVAPTAAMTAAQTTQALESQVRALEERYAAASAQTSVRSATGGFNRRAQEAVIAQYGGDQAASIKQELEAARVALADHLISVNTMQLEADNQRLQEDERAAARRRDGERQRSATEIEELRKSIDKQTVIRQDYEKRVETINRARDRGAIDGAEAERLLALAIKDRDADLKRAAGTTRQVRNEELELVASIVREQGQLIEQHEKEQQAAWERSRETIKGYEDNLALIEREIELSGQSVEVRDRELAIMREQQRIRKEEVTDEEQIAKRLKLAGDMADANSRLRQTRDIFSELQRVGEQAFDRIGNAITEAFAQGSAKAINFGSIAKAVLSEVIQYGLKMAVLNPVLNSVFGGSRATLASTTAAMGGSGGSSGTGGLSLLSSARDLWGAWGNGSISSSLDSWGANNLGFLGFQGGGGLNAAAGGDFISAGLGASSSIPGAAGASAGLLNGGSALAGFSSFSNVLGVAGAALPGLMSGNYVQAGLGTAGAALGTALLPGPGTVIGAIAGNLLGGLFGGKETNPAGSVQLGTDANGNLVIQGSKSKNYDMTEALAGANSTVSGLNTALSTRGLRLNSGSDISQIHYGKDANGTDQQDLVRNLLANVTGGSSIVMSVIARELARGAEASLDDAFSNIDWVRGVYEPLTDTSEAVSAFQQSVDAVMTTFDSDKERASQLGLATDELVKKQLEQVFALQQQRDATVWGIDRALDVRRMRATGRDQEADLLAFDIAALAERESFRANLESLGVSEDAIAQRLVTLEETLGAERLAVAERYNEQLKQAEQQAAGNAAGVIGSLADYARGLNYGESSPLGASEQFMTARSLYLQTQEAALRGDAGALGQFQSYSQDYLTAARNLYGSGSGYASAFEQVKSALEGIGTIAPDTLTASFQAQITQTQTETLVQASARLETIMSSIQRELQQANARPRAA